MQEIAFLMLPDSLGLTLMDEHGILLSGNPIKKVGIPKGACMKLSTRGKYGLYAMYYLALHAGEGPQTLQNISTVGVPKQYLEQILGNLHWIKIA